MYTKNKLAAGVINDTYLRLKPAKEYAYLLKDPEARMFPFTSRMLAPNFRVQRQHLLVASSDPYNMQALNPMNTQDFEYKVTAALRKFGIT